MASVPAVEDHSDMSANVLDHPDLRIRGGALIFPMPVEAYDCLMKHEMLPRGACYDGIQEAMEVEAMPNGRHHDSRSLALEHLFHDLARATDIPLHSETTSPLKQANETGDRRHPDASLFIDPAKIERLDATGEDPAPIPDVVVEIDYTPLSARRYRERLDAYARFGVREIWIWTRTGGTAAEPEGRATFHTAAVGGYAEAAESTVVPGMGTADMETLMREPLDRRRTARARELAERLAPHIAKSPLLSRS